MFVAAAVCPHPPALVPELSTGASGDLDVVRSACDNAVRRMLATRPRLVVCVGVGSTAERWDGTATGSFAAYGVDLRAGGNRASGAGSRGLAPPVLPLPLTVGAWLLDRAGYRGPRAYDTASSAWPAARCLRHGRELGTEADTVGLLVLADGPAPGRERAPGDREPSVPGWDSRLGAWLGSGDLDSLRGLEPGRAVGVIEPGRVAWRVLAGAADGAVLETVLLVEQAPYGVPYFVASWTVRQG